jgi:uncharacterized OB-fold protein
MADKKAAPPADAVADFWAGAARGEFLLQRDPASGRSQFVPRPVNVFGEASPELKAAAGGGTLIAITTARTSEQPYQVGIVALDEGPRVFARVMNAAPDLKPGGRMRLIWSGENDGKCLYAFEPA